MKVLEKLTEGAGIAMNYIGGIAAIWVGAICSLMTLVIWGVAGLGVPSALFGVFFGLTPIGGGVWLFRRGKIQKQVFKVKLQKETVRKLAFKQRGRLRPAQLARHQDWTEEQALEVLKNLVAEDPERIELQLDYESGEIYFEFADIIRALEEQKAYQALPMTESVGRKAVEIAVTLGKTIDTFQKYAGYTRSSMAQRHQHKQDEKYRRKIEQFLREIDDLKMQ